MLLFTSTLWLGGVAGVVQAGSAWADTVAAPSGAGETVRKASREEVQHGKMLFKENCQVCHQEEGKGKPGVAPSLTNKELLSAASDRFLVETIRDGRAPTAMPSYGQVLQEKDIRDIVSYLRDFNQVATLGDSLDADHPAMGDPRLGKRWFAQVCAGCHGPNGEGYLGAGSGTAIGKSGFLSKASDGFIRYIIMNGRSNTPMRGFSGADGLANLTSTEIDDIISYLRIIQN
ncbi:MAG: c-type cytochrome [Magnetococcus sp. XQGC-1]